MSYKPTTCHFCGTQYPEYQAKCDQCNAPILKISEDKIKKSFKFSSDQIALILIACFTLFGAVLIYLFLPSMQASPPSIEDSVAEITPLTIEEQNSSSSSPSYHSYTKRVLMSNVYSVIHSFRLPVIEYYGIMGKLPQNKKELKKELGEDMNYTDEYIKGISIPKDGILEIALTEKFGKNKSITFSPTIAEGKWDIIKWACTSNLPQKHLGSRSVVCKSTLPL